MAAPEEKVATPPPESNGHSPLLYPAATAKSVAAAAEALAEEFAFMGDAGGREAKSQFVLDTAKSLPHHFDLLKQVTERIPGCMSQVYLVGREKPGEPGTFEFVADSDAEIVRGLIAILEQLLFGAEGQAREVAAFLILRNFWADRAGAVYCTSQRRQWVVGDGGEDSDSLAKAVAT